MLPGRKICDPARYDHCFPGWSPVLNSYSKLSVRKELSNLKTALCTLSDFTQTYA